jgi:hypothetical protein
MRSPEQLHAINTNAVVASIDGHTPLLDGIEPGGSATLRTQVCLPDT